MTVRYLSVYDIDKVQEAKDILQSEDEEKISEFFFGMGFDPRVEVVPQKCLHRPMTEDTLVVDTVRFVGKERQDDDWVNSGYCSQENWLVCVGIKDRYLQKHMLELNSVPNFTSSLIDHMKDENVEYRVKSKDVGDDVEQY